MSQTWAFHIWTLSHCWKGENLSEPELATLLLVNKLLAARLRLIWTSNLRKEKLVFESLLEKFSISISLSWVTSQYNDNINRNHRSTYSGCNWSLNFIGTHNKLSWRTIMSNHGWNCDDTQIRLKVALEQIGQCEIGSVEVGVPLSMGHPVF